MIYKIVGSEITDVSDKSIASASTKVTKVTWKWDIE